MSWNPEDPSTWEAGGSHHALRNLAISIPSLPLALCGFTAFYVACLALDGIFYLGWSSKHS